VHRQARLHRTGPHGDASASPVIARLQSPMSHADAAISAAPRRRLFPLFLCACVGSGAFWWLSDGGRSARAAAPLAEQIDSLLVRAGFGINEIWLSGHRNTVDSDLFAALEVEKAGSLLRFDPRQARARLEQLSWIDTAAVTRVLPDRLSIVVRERTPFAVWMYQGRHALIDVTGRVLAHVTKGVREDLPRISGEAASDAAAELIAALRRYPEIAGKVDVADRIGKRRWTLRFTSGAIVQLPADGEAAAIDRLADLQIRQHVLDGRPLHVDLRLAHRTVVRATPDATGGT
jgi:cell division protein FtsQ